MTNSPQHVHPAPESTPRATLESPPAVAPGAGREQLRLPVVAVLFFSLSPVLIVVGLLSLLGTTHAPGATTQIAVGLVLLGIGAVLLTAALVIVAVRSIAQQQLDALSLIARP